MADRRTKRQKLQAMANQSVSPHEAEIAREKLKELREEEADKTIKFTVNFTFTGGYTTSGTYYHPYSGFENYWVNKMHQEAMDKELDGTWVYDFKNEEWIKY